MALPREPLTASDMRAMIRNKHDFSRPSLWDDLINEITPHYVRYRNGDVRYTPPELVYISYRGYVPSPSDCTWIVPGTLERKI